MGKIKKIRSTRGVPKVSLEEQLTSDSLPKKRNREPKIKFRFEEEDAKVGAYFIIHLFSVFAVFNVIRIS